MIRIKIAGWQSCLKSWSWKNQSAQQPTHSAWFSQCCAIWMAGRTFWLHMKLRWVCLSKSDNFPLPASSCLNSHRSQSTQSTNSVNQNSKTNQHHNTVRRVCQSILRFIVCVFKIKAGFQVHQLSSGMSFFLKRGNQSSEYTCQCNATSSNGDIELNQLHLLSYELEFLAFFQ